MVTNYGGGGGRGGGGGGGRGATKWEVAGESDVLPPMKRGEGLDKVLAILKGDRRSF